MLLQDFLEDEIKRAKSTKKEYIDSEAIHGTHQRFTIPLFVETANREMGKDTKKVCCCWGFGFWGWWGRSHDCPLTRPPQLDKVIRELKNEKVRMKNYYDTLEDIESLIKTESGALIKRVMHKRPVRAMVLNPGNFTSNDVTGESTGNVVCGGWVFGHPCLTPPLPLQVEAPSALSPTTTTCLCLTFTLARHCARSVATVRTCTRRRTLGTLVPSLACMWWSVEQRRAAPPC